MKLIDVKKHFYEYKDGYINFSALIIIAMCGVMLWNEILNAYLKTDYMHDTLFNVPKMLLFVIITSLIGFVIIFYEIIMAFILVIEDIKEEINNV